MGRGDYIPENQAFIWPRYFGVYYVKYNDGEYSGLMGRSTANNYAEIFGGEVLKHPRARKWWQFWKPHILPTHEPPQEKEA